jgi:Leucine-rich repeat (LRR) protein
MKYFLSVILFILALSAICAQTQNAEQIKTKMAQVRKSTNWSDPVQAKKANAEIQKLAKQLLLVGQKKSGNTDDAMQEQAEETAELQVKQISRIMNLAAQGEDADVLLAAPVRDEIVEEYKDDESPEVKNPEYYEEMSVLCIDMSLVTVQRTIDQMEKYKSIRTLVITGGKYGASVNLAALLKKAANYPLEELYIINFRNNVSSLPAGISAFKQLTLLSLVNNQFKKLPLEGAKLVSLKTLYIDANPVSTLFPAIEKFNKLENLGVEKTNISKAELEKIKQLLPNCNIISK